MKKNKVMKLVPLIIGMSAMLLTGCGNSEGSESATSSNGAGSRYESFQSHSYGNSDIGTSTNEEYADIEYEAAPQSSGSSSSKDESYDSDSVENTSSDNSSSSQKEKEDYSQKLVKKYYYSFETKTFDESINEITKKVKECGGYIESSDCQGSSNRQAGYTLRIPADKVEEFLNDTSAIGEIMRRSENVDDISNSYYDTKTHIETLETQYKRLLELMEKATKLEDIITLENEITDIEYQLNSYKSNLKLYDNQVDYATIDIDIYEVTEISVTEEDTYWQKIGKGFISGLSAVGTFFKGLFYVLVVCAPALAVIAIVVVIIVIVIKKIIKKSQKKARLKTENNIQNNLRK